MPCRTNIPELPIIYIIDDDAEVCAMLRAVLQENGRTVADFGSSEAFLAAVRPTARCLLVDAYLPGMSGMNCCGGCRTPATSLPAIMITGQQRRCDGGRRHEGRRRRTSSKSRSAAANCWPASTAPWNMSQRHRRTLRHRATTRPQHLAGLSDANAR